MTSHNKLEISTWESGDAGFVELMDGEEEGLKSITFLGESQVPLSTLLSSVELATVISDMLRKNNTPSSLRPSPISTPSSTSRLRKIGSFFRNIIKNWSGKKPKTG